MSVFRDYVGAVVERAVERPSIAPSDPMVNMSPTNERLDMILDYLKWLDKLICMYPSSSMFNMYEVVFIVHIRDSYIQDVVCLFMNCKVFLTFGYWICTM